MIISSVWVAPLLSMAAYASITVALGRLFKERNAAVLGRVRWLVLAAAALQASLPAAFLAMAHFGWTAPGQVAFGLAAGQIVLAGSLWPFIARARTRLAREMGLRARRRLARADSLASQANAWLEQAANVANFGQWRISPGDRAFDWSDEMFAIHGLQRDEFLPQMDEVLQLFHRDDRRYVATALGKLMAEGGNLQMKARICRPDGEMRHVILRGAAQQDGALIGVVVDITDRQVAETRMREANAVALQANAALKEMTTEDELTGVANRRQFDLSLVHEFKRALRSTLPLGLVLINFDNFKSYNELYGLNAGDACLRRIAQAIRAVPRRTGDLVARHGGEQFVVLLPLADDLGAARVANVIHDVVRGMQITHEGSETGFLSVSCGSASFTSVADLNNPLDLVRRADQALYKAKTDGRDRVVAYDAALSAELPDPYGPPAAPETARTVKSRVG